MKPRCDLILQRLFHIQCPQQLNISQSVSNVKIVHFCHPKSNADDIRLVMTCVIPHDTGREKASAYGIMDFIVYCGFIKSLIPKRTESML